MSHSQNLHSGHRSRMKDKFLKSGFEAFSEHERLEYLLYFALPQVNTNEIAHRLINTFGSLAGVFHASYEQLCKVEGIGSHAALLLLSFLETMRAYNESLANTYRYLGDYDVAGRYIAYRMAFSRCEQTSVTCLDNSNRLLSFTMVGQGDASSTAIGIRDIIKGALSAQASRVIVSHSHPGRSVIPSVQDIAATRSLSAYLATLNVELLEHYIVSGDNYFGIISNCFLK